VTHKQQAVKTPKPLSYAASLNWHLPDIAAKLRSAIKHKIPTGYQDETGFHLGVNPAEDEIKWPPVW